MIKSPNRWERRKQRTRRSLKQAVVELIVEKGYDDVTIQDITDRADLGRGTFYVHFKDKEELVWTILQESFDKLHRQIDTGASWEFAHHRAYFSWLATFEYAHANRDLLRIALGKYGNAAFTHRAQHYIAQIVTQDIESLPQLGIDLPDVPHSFVAQFVTGAMVQIVIWWLDEAPEYSPQDITRMFYELVLRQPPPV